MTTNIEGIERAGDIGAAMDNFGIAVEQYEDVVAALREGNLEIVDDKDGFATFAPITIAKIICDRQYAIKVHFLRDEVNGGHANWCAQPLPEEWNEGGDDILEMDATAFRKIEASFNQHQASDLFVACKKAGGKVVGSN